MNSDLDLLQGSWRITALEVEGRKMPAAMFAEGRLVIRGSRFLGAGMGAEYQGTLEIDPSGSPRRLNMKFDAGPETGNTNLGIYEVAGDTFRICLATHGNVRPAAFDSSAGSGFALETLTRGEAVASGRKTKKPRKSVAEASESAAKTPESAAGSAPATEFEGDWPMVSGVMNGQPMDQSLVQWVKRMTRGNRITVMAGPQVMMQVTFTTDPSQSPKAIEYVNLAGTNKGKAQSGIYALEGDLLKVCVAAPGSPRPAAFESVKGDGRTLTVWKRP